MAQLSNYEKVSRVVNDGAFINRVQAAVAAAAIDRGQNPPDAQRFLVPVANELSAEYVGLITGEDDETISTQIPIAVTAISDAELDAAVAVVYGPVTGYIAPAAGQLALADLANDPRFQARVYQIIAAKANGVLSQAAIPDNEGNRIMRGFAMRLQAGLYLTPQFKQNFAINILGAIGSVEAVTDASLSATIDALLTLFVASRVELNASGVTLDTVLNPLPTP